MASPEQNTIDIIWSDPEIDFLYGESLKSACDVISSALNVSSLKTFVISDHRAVIRLELTGNVEQVITDIEPAFGPNLRLVAKSPNESSNADGATFIVTPSLSDDQVTRRAPQAATEENQTISNSLNGIETLFRRLKPTLGNPGVMNDLPWTRKTTGLAVALALSIWFMLPPAFQFKAVPWGVDQWGHLTRLELLRDSVATNFTIPMWLPHWYSGQDLWQYYPPVTSFLLLPGALLTGNALSGYTLLVTPLTALGAIAFLWAFRPWLGNLGAFFGALIFALSPATVGPIFGEGNIAWGIQQAILPLNIGILARAFISPKRNLLILYGSTVALMIMAHSMMALMSLMLSVPFAIGYWASGGTSINKLFWIGVAGTCGAGIAAFWLIPGITHVDLQNVPLLVKEKVTLWSSSSYLFNRSAALDLIQGSGVVPSRYLGLILPVATIVGIFAGVAFTKYRPLTLAFGLMAIAAFIIGLGVDSPIWRYVPLNDSLLPNRSFNLTIFAAAFLIPMGFRALVPVSNVVFVGVNGRKARLNIAAIGLIIVALLLTVENMPWLQDRSPIRYVGDEIFEELILDSDTIWEGGRYWDITPINDSRQHYTVTVDGNRMSVIGWATEGSVHAEELTLHYRELAVPRAAGLVRRADIYNTEIVWLEKEQTQLVNAFSEQGYSPINNIGIKVLMKRDAPQSYLLKQDRTTLAIGSDIGMLTSVVPSVAVGNYEFLSEYPREYLDTFETIFIAAPELPESPVQLRNWIHQRLQSGQRVIIDPRTPGSELVARFSPTPTELRGSFDLSFDETEFELGPFDVDGVPFSTRLPTGFVESTEQVFIRYGKAETGELIILPFGLVQHAFNTPQNTGVTELLAHLLQVKNGSSQQPYPRIPTQNLTGGTSNIDFEFDMPEAGYVMLSVTYSPHWNAEVNNRPQNIIRHENMILLKADQGLNTVSLDYRATKIQTNSAALSIAAIVALFLAATFGTHLNFTQRFEIHGFFNTVLIRFPVWLFADRSKLDDDPETPDDDSIT